MKDRIVLPLPPSVNAMYGTGFDGHKYLTEAAVVWKQEAILTLRTKQRVHWRGMKVVVECWVYWKDNRRRDIDNLCKCINDSIQESGVIDDDRWVLFRAMDWEVDRKRPRIELRIYKLES